MAPNRFAYDVVGTGNTLWKSMNRGGSWGFSKTAIIFDGESIAIDPGSPNRMY